MTGHMMSVFNFRHQWRLFRARGFHLRAAGMKAAPGRGADEGREIIGDLNVRQSPVSWDWLWNGIQQSRGIGMGRMRIERFDRGQFADAPQIHHCHSVGYPFDHRQVMGDEQHGETKICLYFVEQIEDLGLDGYIQGRNRFITDQHLGPCHQGPGNAHPLTLTAGEPTRILILILSRVEPDGGHHSPNPGCDGGFIRYAHNTEWGGNGSSDPAPRVQGGDGVLKHHLNPGADGPEGFTIRRGQIATGQEHMTGCRRRKLYDGAGKARFTTPRLTNQSEGFLPIDPETDAGYGANGVFAPDVERDMDIPDVENWLGFSWMEIGHLQSCQSSRGKKQAKR
jgi:hypothetical protein